MDSLTPYQQAILDQLQVGVAVVVVASCLALALLAFGVVSRLHA